MYMDLRYHSSGSSEPWSGMRLSDVGSPYMFVAVREDTSIALPNSTKRLYQIRNFHRPLTDYERTHCQTDAFVSHH